MCYQKLYPFMVLYALGLFLVGVLLDDPSNILPGLRKISASPDVLITDYIALAGAGAAFANAALVTLVSLLILYLSKDPVNGFTIVSVGLMSGFSLFGKTLFNMWPIFIGTWLYARCQREPFAKYVSVALLATALSPLVSFLALTGEGGEPGHPVLGILLGLLIGFVLPSLSGYTYKVQNGMNLYNTGFACGLLAMLIVPVLIAFGRGPERAFYWSTGSNGVFALIMGLFCLILVLGGLFLAGKPAWAVWAGYRRLLHTSGRAPSDYLRMFGGGPILLNTGINGLVATAYILAVGGDLNGPTLGGILTVMCFSAYGKHTANIVPVMVGVLLGGLVMRYSPSDPSLQMAALFGTTLAPVSGCFGWPFGILAGFLHSAVVLQAGSILNGVNLYNNGFSGGLIAIVLFPTLTAIFKHRKPVVEDLDYFDIFEDDGPVAVPLDDPEGEERRAGPRLDQGKDQGKRK